MACELLASKNNFCNDLLLLLVSFSLHHMLRHEAHPAMVKVESTNTVPYLLVQKSSTCKEKVPRYESQPTA